MRLAQVSSWFLLAAVVGAQADPRCERVVLTTLSVNTGVPVPGVAVHVLRHGDYAPPITPDGWLRVIDPWQLGLHMTRPVYSDRTGRVELLLNNGSTKGYHIFTRAPFVGHLPDHFEARELPVERLEPFELEVVDHRGAPLPRFVVALYADGRDQQVVWTDQYGRARFGLLPECRAHWIVAPAGWIGSRDGMPTVSMQLPRERVRLVVPPFGAVRVRATVHDEPQRVAFAAAQLHRPSHYHGGNTAQAGKVVGVQFGPIALGQRIAGRVQANGVWAEFTSPGPVVAGETVEVDVDLTPPAGDSEPRPRSISPAAGGGT